MDTIDHSPDIQLVGRVSDVVRAQLPLAAGLRALAEEAPSRRIRGFLAAASRRLDAGEPVDQVFDRVGRSFPASLKRLLKAGVESGRLGSILELYLQNSRRAQDHRRQAALALVYPAILLLAAAAIYVFFMTQVVPEFDGIFQDFGIALPLPTRFLIFASDVWLRFGIGIILALLAPAAIGLLVLRMLGGRPLTRRIVCSLPILGTTLRCSALSEFCQLLAILIENDVPLSESLRLAGSGVRDADLEQGAHRLADEVARGLPLQSSALTNRQFPPLLLQVFRWEDRRDAFVDALRAAGEVFEARAQIAGRTLGVILEPITIVGVAVSVAFVFLALFVPLAVMIDSLV